ncbi:MAG: hypothetical protein DHS20C16_26090 [Phycisphaerae bacterium]|nr:MAG: hypothetical protein DHS20C16_26090 [Phycisphaerae bacterium]
MGQLAGMESFMPPPATTQGSAMSKRYDFVDDALEDKLRIGETILWIYGCLLILAGGGFVIAKCLVADFGTAFVGFVATISGAGLIALCWLLFRMIRKVASNAFRLERLKQRIDELELEFDAGASGIAPVQSQPLPVDDLVESQHENELFQFQHALSFRDLETCRQLWPVVKESVDTGRASQFEQALGDVEHQTAETLRIEFAAQLKEHEYATALQTGQRIAELFPQSRMASDFQSIRKRVETLAQSSRNEDNRSGHADSAQQAARDDTTEHANS